MTDCLVYWKEFWEALDDLDNGEYDDVENVLNFDWYTQRETFLKQVAPGDTLWVVITAGDRFPGEWRLLQRIVVTAVEELLNTGRPYHAIGDPAQSCYFNIKSQPDLAPFLQELDFVSGKRIQAHGGLIGRSLQSIRPLTLDDSHRLDQYAQGLTEFQMPVKSSQFR